MKINMLELPKTISDFIFLWVDNPEKKAKQLFEMKHTLDARGHWFEKYIQYYFQKYKHYRVELIGSTWSRDNWIDLMWEKIVKWIRKKIIVQCKKHCVKDITLNDVTSFYGQVADEYHRDKANTELFYITTSKFTKSAQDFLKTKWARAIDFSHISRLVQIYPLHIFKKELLEEEGEKEVSLSFEKSQIELDMESPINSAADSEVFQLLKQVRRDISNSKQLQLGSIAKNDTLELLAQERPHNLQALKRVSSQLPIRERKKIEKYGNFFIDRLKYTPKQTVLEKRKWFRKFFIN